MGVDLLLCKNGKCLANLGRAYYYEQLEDATELKYRIMKNIIVQLYSGEMVDFIEFLEDSFDEIIKYGKLMLLQNLRNDGCVTMTELEWKKLNQNENRDHKS